MNSTVGYRVIEYLLDEKKTIQFKNWEVRDYNNPIQFTYGSSTAISSIGTGMHEAIGFMKYKNSEAKVIVPSGLNISTYNQNVIPVGSDIKITVIN